MECYDRASAAFGWKTRNPKPGSMREGDWLIGMGCATAIYPTNIGAATARVRLDGNGRVRVQSASHEIGTGIRTVAGQMAAEQFGTDFSRVTVEMGDSDLPPAPVSGGSNSTASVCNAVLKACQQIRDCLLDKRAARTVNRDLQDYLVPVNADIGQVEVILVPETDDFVNPAGIKGIGELGNVGTNAAVANAVFHATGTRIRTLPIRLENLMPVPTPA